MVSCLGYAPPVSLHFSFFVHPYSGANDTDGFLAVHHLFTIGTVFSHDFLVSVAKQGVGDIVLANKLVMRFFIIRRDAEDKCIEFLEFFIQSGESNGLFCASRCVIFGIEVDDYILSAKVL